MNTTAYLVGSLDIKADPPWLVSVNVYSGKAGTITVNMARIFAFDIVSCEGTTYEEARKNVVAWARKYTPWAYEAMPMDEREP